MSFLSGQDAKKCGKEKQSDGSHQNFQLAELFHFVLFSLAVLVLLLFLFYLLDVQILHFYLVIEDLLKSCVMLVDCLDTIDGLIMNLFKSSA